MCFSAFDRLVFNRTWKTIFQSKRNQFGFRLLHGENVHFSQARGNATKMGSSAFLTMLAERLEFTVKDRKKCTVKELQDIVITKRGSTVSELLRISPRNLTFDGYLNPIVQFIFAHLRADIRLKTDREWCERRLEYRWNVQHAVS
mmetsp:Transcript_15890/g.32292  ORF Transcript_15890/g.32292 Transcript_15890/m.32292 type:complete len:145 (-) Transcript_15890:278-712(-)